MFQQSISKKIQNVNLLNKEDLQFFYDLKNKYPYAEIFQLIHLQLIKKNDPLSFEDELSKVAYKIRDRNKLIEILEANEIFNLNEKIETENLKQKEIQENQKEILSTKFDEDSTKENEIKTTELNTQIAAEAFSTIFSIDFEPTIQYQIEDETIEESKILQKTTFEKQNIKVELEKKTAEKSQKTFINWLKTIKKEEKLDTNKIIDTIITTNPTISRPKKEFYNPNKQALKSVDDEQLVYTETLAKILEMQGNFSKAISAYKQLSLTIPEKNTYFAQKIKELNEKLNTK
jgi:hypothetical protein